MPEHPPRWIRQSADDSLAAMRGLAEQDALLARVAEAAEHLAGVLSGGGRILAIGNGGSCAQAAHLAEELTGRYRSERPALGAVACTDGGHLTCTANDFGFEAVFERWVRGLGRRGDCLVALSTSGRSENVRRALSAAREMGCSTLGLLGGDGGPCAALCDRALVMPGSGSDRVQEAHMLAIHLLIEGIERALFPAAYTGR